MRKTEIFLNSVIYAVYFLAACLCGVGVDFLIIKVLDSIIVMSAFAICIIRSVIYFAVPMAVIFVCAYKEGYKEASFYFGETFLSCIIATLIHFLFALLFAFNQFFAGGVKFTSAIIVYGADIQKLAQISEIRYRVFIPVFFAFSVIYCVNLVLAKRLGCDARLQDRRQLFAGRSK